MGWAQVLQVSHAMVQLKQPWELRLPGNAMLWLDPSDHYSTSQTEISTYWDIAPIIWPLDPFRMTLHDPFWTSPSCWRISKADSTSSSSSSLAFVNESGKLQNHKKGHSFATSIITPLTATVDHISPSPILHELPACNIPKTNCWQIWSNIFCSAADDSGNDVTTWYLKASTVRLQSNESSTHLGWTDKTLWDQRHMFGNLLAWKQQPFNQYHITSAVSKRIYKNMTQTYKLCIDCRCHVLNMNTCRGTGASYRYRPTTRERHPVSAMSGWPSRCHWRQLNASGGFH